MTAFGHETRLSTQEPEIEMSRKKSTSRHTPARKANAVPGESALAGGKSAPGPKAPAPSASGRKRTVAIVAVIAVAAAIVGLLISNGAGGGRTGATAGEREYLGRFLPEGYEAPKLTKPSLYTSTVPMTRIAGTQNATGISVPLSEIVANKNVSFEYVKADGDKIPLLAFVRPSGKVFLGVSFCPPCQGEGQTIAGDGTLTCDSCGTKRELESQRGISGACKLYPLDELPATVSGDDVVVDKGALERWTPQPLDRPIG